MTVILISVGLKRADRLLFKPVTCDMQRGDIVEIVGPNGIGKTSLLKVLAGWIKPNQGLINHVYKYSALYLSLKNGFDNSGTVQENLDYLWVLEGEKTPFPETCLDVFHINKLKNRLLWQLSAGQCQRVHLTRLLLIRRDVWLLDEPFTSLDEGGRQTLRELCHRHQHQGGLVVIASPHSLGLGNKTLDLQSSPLFDSFSETSWIF